MRILNREQLESVGNRDGRRDVAAIMEAGLTAADPYRNACRLLRREGDFLYVGNALFEADNDPASGVEEINLKQTGDIYVVGAGKGVQRVAKALEEVLGERLAGGEVIAKYGDEPVLQRIHVTFGAHPVPDQGCVEGSMRIEALARRVKPGDLVFTIMGNGCSSLLTLPEEGVDLEDVRRITRLLQIEKGAPTVELNVVRNHIDRLKGGKISMLFGKARQIHLIMTDANHHVIQAARHDYEGLMRGNVWLHNLPEGSTFAQAEEILRRYEVWEECPEGIKALIRRADPGLETIKYEAFARTSFRVFGVMPDSEHFLPAAIREAESRGYHAAVLTQLLQAEASQCAKVLSAVAMNIAEFGEPFEAPVALFSSGEMLVTVDRETGVGGRNQEFALACALGIAGNPRIVIGSVDSDGTDGPGGLKLAGAPSCLGGGIVDGCCAARAKELGIDIRTALRTHNTSEALWRLNDGMWVEQNISLNDLTVILVQGRGSNG
ncbi:MULTISPECIES: DUF4147 domain-containing protein [Enterocloster]|uniref:Glycerate 2-kinase n=1 Tax=Enterocloster lavalensis TaxID=460384 RepID=A0A1I0CNG0_9FIRM|nr:MULTISPECIES: DUF4147 domain-containing protein [Enterocloster]MDR3755554.1 DUF4147 domain-containing protein [Enterocloster sp.]SET21126.1 glycerate 2-kinase [Enterocloster lavalensis]